MPTTTRRPAQRQQQQAKPQEDAQAQNRQLAVIEAREAHPMVVAIEERMPQIAQMLPEGVDPERFKSLVLRTLISKPDLLQADPASVLVAISQAAQEGIEPTGQAGGGYLVVFREDNVPKVQLIRDYRFIAQRIVQTGAATRLDVNVVREGDEFAFELGTNPWLKHVPNLDSLDKPSTHFYALAWLPDGTVKFEVMTRAQVEHVGQKSRAWRNGPWQSDFDQMGRKTLVKRIANYLPLPANVRSYWAQEDEVEFATVEDMPAAQLETAERSASRRERIAQRRRGTPTDDADPEDAATASADEPPSLAATPGDSDEPTGEPVDEKPKRRKASCTHPANKRQQVDGVGVVCGVDGCGEILAAYAPEAETAEPAARPRRSAEKPPADDSGQDDAPNVLMRRLHAQARARGFSHDDLKLVIAAVAGFDPDETASYSMNDLVDDLLEDAVEVLDGIPQPLDDEKVSHYVWPRAQAKGVKGADADATWQAIDVLAGAWSGKSPDEMTAAEWIAFAIRLERGEFDAQQ